MELLHSYNLQQSLGTVQCDHAPFILFILLPIFRTKLPNSKRIVLVPKCYIINEIALNFLNEITNARVGIDYD